MFVGEVKARRVGAVFTVEVARQGNFRMRQASSTFLNRHFFNGFNRIGHQLIERQRGIRDSVNEGGVGTVFQQTAHQIRQQRFMGADRGVNTARTV